MIVKQEKLLFEDLPNLYCPKCSKGVLKIIEDTKILKYPSKFSLLPKEPYYFYDPEGNRHLATTIYDVEAAQKEEYIATFFLECPRIKCKEVVATCGQLRYDTEIFPDDDGETCYDTQLYYYPNTFLPGINLFLFPLTTPESIVMELKEAFSLFWNNPSACGNSIRKSVERIIDEIAAPVSGFVKLHSRIESLGEEYSALKEYLFATKWIGNDGSHQSDLTHDDVLLAFEFIEQCLIEVYKNDHRDLNSLAQKINASKKPVSKTTE